MLAARALDARSPRSVSSTRTKPSQVNNARTQLKEWFGERERSYTGRVGLRLARAVTDTREEIARLAQTLRSAQEASDVPSGIEEQQRSLARKLKLVFLGALVAIVVAVVLYVFELFGISDPDRHPRRRRRGLAGHVTGDVHQGTARPLRVAAPAS